MTIVRAGDATLGRSDESGFHSTSERHASDDSRRRGYAMIIVSGHLVVDAAERTAYLTGCDDVIRQARQAQGCIDFYLSPDPLEPDRINVFEQWESREAVEAFRGAGPSDEQRGAIRDAAVFQHEVASSHRL
jgi:quinol monooxygenase YgiN